MNEQLLDVYTYALSKGAVFSVAANGREWMARCINPECSSRNDAFSVQPEGKLTGRWPGYGAWMCRKCWDPSEIITQRDSTQRKRGWGTIADLVMVCEGMNFREAEQFILEYEGETVPLTHRPMLPRARKTDEQWYEKFLPYLKASLSSEYVQAVLGYAASRGLTAETATFLKFGFSVDAIMKETGYCHIPFLIIPWHKEDGTLYRRINRRNLHNPLPEDEDKYRLVEGCDHDELYLGYMLKQQTRPTFLVESELDAATVLQEAGDLVNVVATGSAEHGKGPLTESRLRRQPFVFVSFDDDEQGEKASAYWLSKLDTTKSIRYKPLLHDANEMHTKGMSVRTWVEAGLTYFVAGVPVQIIGAAPPIAKLTDAQAIAKGMQLREEAARRQVEQECAEIARERALYCCTGCGEEVEHYSFEGIGYCRLHWQEALLLPPQRRQLLPEQITERFVHALPGWRVELVPGVPTYQIPQRVAASLPDFWVQLRARLGTFHASDAPPVIPPRRYPAPFPCYELREENGIKQLWIIGMHHPTESGLIIQAEESIPV